MPLAKPWPAARKRRSGAVGLRALARWDRLKAWPGWRGSRGKILGLLLVLTAACLVSDGWQAARGLWCDYQRPTAIYRRAIRNGLAVSLNALEKHYRQVGQLPGLDLQGVLLDRTRNDWILFGEPDPSRPSLPLDAIAVAVRALRNHPDPPGVDIRPSGGTADESQPVQRVSYFGGVQGTIVGKWFFQFDYWMKRVSLGQESVPLSSVPVYWHRAVQALEHEVAVCHSTGSAYCIRRNRCWLCMGDFHAIEDSNALAFQSTPLRVLAEDVREGSEIPADFVSPSTTRGISDPLAAEFAARLTEHLPEITRAVPIQQIDSFARLLAGFTWLMEMDPYRDLDPWLNAALTPTHTPGAVPTLAMQTVREHTVVVGENRGRHVHMLQLRGGVVLSPRLIRARAGDDSLAPLCRALLAARPAGDPVMWAFTCTYPKSQT
jgi:hypothetical protein